MLAQNFMTPKQLDITATMHAALVKVLGMLERGEIVHAPDVKDMFRFPKGQLNFNMNVWEKPRGQNCGTVHCIGGWAEHVSDARFRFGPLPRALGNLFYPPSNSGLDYERINTYQAASALRNYLTLGEARWDEVLGE